MTPAPALLDWAAALLLLAGGGFTLVAGLGLLRLPDALVRMHASTKAGTLGAGFILLAAALVFGDLGTSVRMGLTIAFLLLTAPIAAHLIGRAAYRTATPLSERTVIDELASHPDWKGRRGEDAPEHILPSPKATNEFVSRG